MLRFVAGLVVGLALGLVLAATWRDDAPAVVVPASSSPHERPIEAEPPAAPAVAVDAAPESAPLAPGEPDRDDAKRETAGGDSIPDATIRGRLVSRDGAPIAGGRILAIAARHKFATIAVPQVRTNLWGLGRAEDGGGYALTREDGAFAIFGLEPGAEYAMRIGVPLAENLQSVAPPALAAVVRAPAESVELVDSTCRLLLSFELDAALAAPPWELAQKAVALWTDAPLALNATSMVPLRTAVGFAVPPDVPFHVQVQGAEFRRVEREGIVVTAAEGTRREVVALKSWGEGNSLTLSIVDSDGRALERAAVAVIEGIVVDPIAWALSPVGTEGRLEALDAGRCMKRNQQPGPQTAFVVPSIASGLAPASLVLEMPETGGVEHRVVLHRGGRLRISVESSALPVESLRVVAADSGGTDACIWLSRTGETANVHVRATKKACTLESGHPLPPGPYNLVWRRAGEARETPFRIDADRETAIVLR